jgi:hypothetical protein
VFGSSNPYSQPGETTVSVSTRNLRSTDHYNGTEEQVQRQTLDTYVVNLQHMMDISIGHTFTERFSANIGVPFLSSSWGIPSPLTGGSEARANENGRGIGDISISGRYWLLPTGKYRSGNIAFGLGMKFPTGNEGTKDMYPDRNGNNNQLRYVDMSVQPGDGGWGIMMDLQGFKRIPHGQLFGAAAYLANPRDSNQTTSGGINRAATPPATYPADGTGYNSVPDQFLVRLAAAAPIARTGMAASLAWRAEGLPRYDLIGQSHGFRRPGIEMFIEPGISYARGPHVYSMQVPIGYYRNRFPNPYTDNKGDATFPKYIILASYSYSFGAKGIDPALK